MTKNKKTNVGKGEKWISNDPRSNYVQQGTSASSCGKKERDGERRTEIERDIRVEGVKTTRAEIKL